MSESAVFELKLQIQHLEEKLTFLAGGTNGAELVAVLMEKDAELEQNVSQEWYLLSGRRFLQLRETSSTSDIEQKNRCFWFCWGFSVLPPPLSSPRLPLHQLLRCRVCGTNGWKDPLTRAVLVQVY